MDKTNIPQDASKVTGTKGNLISSLTGPDNVMKFCTDKVGDYFHNVQSAMKTKVEMNCIYKMCKIVPEGEHPEIFKEHFEEAASKS